MHCVHAKYNPRRGEIMDFKHKFILSLTFLAFGSSASAAYLCPTTTTSVKKMYQAMGFKSNSSGDLISGKVFGFEQDDSYPMVFLGIAERSESEIQFDSQYRTDTDTYEGVFKIGYDYDAKECRRQIIIEESLSKGTFKGWLAVDVCNPKLKDVPFDALNKFNPSMEIKSTHVDENGNPTVIKINEKRFKVRLNEIRFVESGSGSDSLCQLEIILDPSVNYFANIGTDYKWDFPKGNVFQGQTWTYDETGTSVKHDSYKNK